MERGKAGHITFKSNGLWFYYFYQIEILGKRADTNTRESLFIFKLFTNYFNFFFVSSSQTEDLKNAWYHLDYIQQPWHLIVLFVPFLVFGILSSLVFLHLCNFFFVVNSIYRKIFYKLLDETREIVNRQSRKWWRSFMI